MTTGRRMRWIGRGAAFAATLGWAMAAAAEGEPQPPLDTGNTAWVLTSSALVLMMTLPGLALFYAGLVRAKNALSLFMQCMVSAGVVGVLWIVVGYSARLRRRATPSSATSRSSALAGHRRPARCGAPTASPSTCS